LGTRHRTKTNKTKKATQKTKKMSNTHPIKNPMVKASAGEGYVVPVSYKTPVVLLI